MRIALGVLAAAVFVAALVLATLREGRVTCEVCVVFQGREACRTASAADRDQALYMAQNTACAVIARGVTPGMQCQRTRPRRASCEDE